jgi:imidazolonepropionase-like amidohydrolase
VIKNKFGLSKEEMLFPNAPRSIKFASGENPKRVYGTRNQLPSTRMGNFEVMRQAFEDAKVYRRDWDAYNDKVAKGDKDARPPHRDLKLEALADILRGKLMVQIHCYRADEFLTEEAIAQEYGFKIRAFHHALEMYKVGGKIAADGTAIATFTDWYGGKYEMWDGIPWNAVMSMREGVRVALKSDSNDHIRRLNQEAGKMVHYGGATEDEAITMVTLNPAWIMGIDDKTGSLDVGKDGDVVIWNRDPLSTYARAEKVYIDGDLFFDSSLPGFGTTHFSGVMHGSGFGAGEDDDDDQGDN